MLKVRIVSFIKLKEGGLEFYEENFEIGVLELIRIYWSSRVGVGLKCNNTRVSKGLEFWMKK